MKSIIDQIKLNEKEKVLQYLVSEMSSLLDQLDETFDAKIRKNIYEEFKAYQKRYEELLLEAKE